MSVDSMKSSLLVVASTCFFGYYIGKFMYFFDCVSYMHLKFSMKFSDCYRLELVKNIHLIIVPHINSSLTYSSYICDFYVEKGHCVPSQVQERESPLYTNLLQPYFLNEIILLCGLSSLQQRHCSKYIIYYTYRR